ncbi:unnamed protein product [Penicillium olsonii]|nr:unnamed protein product [Penicillium olsonii]CAG7927628.1 unnamed protein product [Penicillium olsonii]
MSCSNYSRPASRIFVFLGLAATLLLLSYQLILYRSTELGVLVSNESSPAPSDPALSPAPAPAPAEPEPEPELSSEVPPEKVPMIVPQTSTEPIPEATPKPTPEPTKELVFAAMEASNMSWVDEHLPNWTAKIYRADASQGLTVPMNKGNEAMVYLTYIIDRYWSLPDVSIFLHGERYQWHVDNPLYDSVISIRDLQASFVLEAGYVSLRCAWSVGCPRELEPARYLRERPDDSHHPAAMEYPDRFMELFPRAQVPEEVGAPCCSQFALSRGKIHEQSLEHYVRLQKWLIDTELNSGISGRIFEYSWHSRFAPGFLWVVTVLTCIVIFGKPTQYCLDQKECYCRTYGYCNLTDAEMQSQWVWRGLKLPDGWPEPKPEPEPEPEPTAEDKQSKESP